MNILLTDEEMNGVHNGEIHGDDDRLCQAQLKKVVEWLKEHNRAFEIPNLPLGYPFALDEDDYWQALLKEVE